MAKTPKIRFKNFSDEWVESRLGELGNILTGSTPPTNISELYDNNGIPWVTPTDITSNLISKTCKRLSKKGELVSRIVPSKTILVTCIASIGKNAMLLTRGSFNQQINSLTVNDNNDPYFMLTQSSLWSEQMKKQAAQATMQIVNKTEFSNIKAYIPNLKEQEKIGAFFSKLDKLIALHQSKFEKLQKIKKSCLQNLFPQNNQNTPKIRFKNFTDEWENNNLGEICKIIKGEQINKLSLLENGKYYVLNGGISPSGYINTYNTLENTISISEGGNSCGYVKFNIEKFWSGGHNYTLNELKTKTLFLYSFLKAKQQKIMALRVGSGLPNIQKNFIEYKHFNPKFRRTRKNRCIFC